MKKSHLILLVLVSMLFTNTSFSQDASIELKYHSRFDTFDLSKYILPDIEYKVLNLQFKLNSTNLPLTLINQREDILFSVISSAKLFNSIYKNNRKLIVDGYDVLEVRGNFKKAEYTEYLPTGISKRIEEFGFGYINISTNRDYKFYKNENKFYEIDFKGRANYILGNGINRFGEYNISNLSTNLGIGFLVGYGRVEDVTDAWHAIRILKDLSRIDLLEKDVTDDDIIEVASSISKSRYKRVFDWRVKRKESITALDKKIKEKGLVKNRGIDYFTALSDMFLYGANRYSGSYFSGGLYPFGHLSSYFDDNNRMNSSYGIGAKLKYEYRKPLNQFWQFDMYAEINSIFYQNIDKFAENTIKRLSISTDPRLAMSFAYYPSTRTEIKSGLNIAYQYFMNKHENTEEFYNLDYFRIGFENSIRYYISPRASIDFDFNIYNSSGWINSTFDLSNNNINNLEYIYLKEGINYYTNLKFNYSIF